MFYQILCRFANRVVYTPITVTRDLRYIYEGFLIWIIPRRTSLMKP